jgi:hypothetical protein
MTMTNLQATNQREEIINGSYDRPAGVSVIAVLLAIGGAMLLITQLVAFNRLNETSSVLGIPAAILQGAIGFLGLLGVAGAGGMWLGKRWGWWLALFFFAYALNVLISIQGISEQLGVPASDQGVNYGKYGIRVLWNALLMVYLCGETAVTFFFGMKNVNKWKAVLLVFAVCIGIFLITTLVVA